jgi:hypothetical protein
MQRINPKDNSEYSERSGFTCGTKCGASVSAAKNALSQLQMRLSASRYLAAPSGCSPMAA